MKKIIITLAIIVSYTTSLFATEDKIKPEVLDAFKSQFSGAKEVTWMAGTNYYKAAFTCHGAWLFAYYNTTGEYLGLTRNISSQQLPLFLQNSLKRKYADYWITSVVEESNDRGFNNYITVENADQKIVLKSKNGDDWETYRKNNKI